ncbi:Pycsar system effector family protein [Streptomyces sp. NPDC102406]|uniref:Pycsar system effector family protein n=1 Tax=Streptomyces sp. NPDC102406 TaxID=3366171 RepID=UPI003827260B
MTRPASTVQFPQAGAPLLAELRVDIARADAKAAVLIGALGLTAGVPGALLAGRGWTPGPLPVPVASLWWAGTLCLLTALLAVLLAVAPRHRARRWAPGRPLTYFDDVRRAAEAGLLAEALAQTESDPASALILALADTSRIAARKHFWIRAGLTAFGGAVLLLPAALLLS